VSAAPRPDRTIVNCAAYTEGCRAADIELEELSDYVAKDGHFVWIGLHEPSEETLRTLQTELGLHDLAVEDAHRAHQRPKLEEYGPGLFVALRTATWDAATRKIDVGETHLFVGSRYVVSVRHGETTGYADVRGRLEATPRLLRQGPSVILYALMDSIVDRYFPIVDALEEELDRLEESIFGAQPERDVAERIYGLKSEVITIKRAVSPLIDVCNRLVRYDQGLVADEVRPYFRDVYDHVVRINESIDNMRELLTSALEANLALVSIRQNEVMKTLAGWAAIFGIATLMAGIWGMNFEHMPELHPVWGYPAALGSMGAVAVGMYWWLKRSGWL
jgi:magnesium transporter